jgi:hypothetical protein
MAQKRDSHGRFLKATKTSKKPAKASTPRTARTLKFEVFSDRQIGKTTKWKDEMLPAKRPGKRISADGNIYYEYRKNRTDRRGSRL